jgi:autotransporter-associated beta strand protein
VDSATPGELLFVVPENIGAVNSAIIDNAGADSVFGNGDDLPVSVVKAGTGRLALNSPDNWYSGGTHVLEGILQLTHPIKGAVNIVDATLELRPSVENARLTTGQMIVESSPLKRSVIQVASPSSPAMPTWVTIGNLTVRPGSNVQFNAAPGSSSTRLRVEGPVDARGAILSVGPGHVTRFDGQYVDDASTTYISRQDYRVSRGVFEFDTGMTTDIRGAFYQTELRAHGDETELRFHGSLLAEMGDNTVGYRNVEISAYRAKVVVMPEAAIETAAGWIGIGYRGGSLAIRGDSLGEVEFRPGFRLIKTAGTNNAADVGTSFVNFLGPVTWVTHESGHLPNFDQEFMSTLPPNVYPGHINLGVDGVEWQVRSNPQTYNQKIDIAGSTRISTAAALSFSPESFVQLGYEPTLTFPEIRYPNGGAIKRSGLRTWPSRAACPRCITT